MAKVLISPLLLATSTFAMHKWGAVVGGLILGMPLVSGPVSVMLFAQYGSRFAVSAAYGTLLGFVAAAAFCASYAFVSRYRPWQESLLASLVAFFLSVWLLSLVHMSLGWILGFVLMALTSLAFTIAEPDEAPTVAAPRKRSLAIRMVAAGFVVLLITASARFLGPEMSGLLAPLPVLATIMAVSFHRNSKSDAVHGLLRSAVLGSWGGAAFFATVIMLLGAFGPALTYSIAAAAALMAGSFAMQLQVPVPSEHHEVAVARRPAEAIAVMPYGIR
jgi:MFS family permease